MKENYEELLEQGLAKIASGQPSVEAFLSAHPAAAPELWPLLEAALLVDRAVAVEPRPAFRYLARARFADAVQATRGGSWLKTWTLLLRPATLVLLVVVLAASVGAGNAAASDDTVPGHPLYPIKRAQEEVRLALAGDDLERARLQARQAERRLKELQVIAPQAEPERVSRLAQQIARNWNAVHLAVQHERRSGQISPETQQKLNRIRRLLRESLHQDGELFQAVLAQVPPDRRPMLARLLQLSQQEYRRAVEAVEDN